MQISDKAYESLRGFCVASMGILLMLAGDWKSSPAAIASIIGLLLLVIGLTICVCRGIPVWRQRVVWWWLTPGLLYFFYLIYGLVRVVP